MSRKEALLRLHKNLVATRDALRRQLMDDLNVAAGSGDGSGDVVDTAMDISQNELHSQLAVFESRELLQIERAIELLRTGRYGTCERCATRIPVARLKALPYTTHCIGCQQKQESRGKRRDLDAEDWSSALEFEGRQSDREITIGDLEIPLD